jgi:hypothetical protein
MTDSFLNPTDNRGFFFTVYLKHPYHQFLEPDKILLEDKTAQKKTISALSDCSAAIGGYAPKSDVI